MKKSLKYKFFNLFFMLILVNAIIGVTSLTNLSNIRKSIDTLMSNNYESINASNKMLEAIESQNLDIITYIDYPQKNTLGNFYKTSDNFYKYYNFQLNNVTEQGESDINKKIGDNYIAFLNAFTHLIEVRGSNGKESALSLYVNELHPIYLQLRNAVKTISTINEKAMLEKRDAIKNEVLYSTNIIFLLCTSLTILSLILSIRYINKFLKPIYLLHNNIIKAKEGNFGSIAQITSNDEIGTLAEEFNKMSEKISEFQHSTLGKLMDEKNKSLAIVKSISDPVIVLDINYRIMLLNDACEDFFQIKQYEVINRHILEAIPNGNLFDFISTIMDNSVEKDNKIMSFKNDSITFNINLSLIKDNKEVINGIIVYFQNITEIKKVEKLKHDFVSSLSHEIKTPLTSIMMGASLLEDSSLMENKNYNKIISTISEDSAKLLNLTNNFLRIAQIESDKAILNIDPWDISYAIERSIEDFSTLIEKKNITLLVNIEEKLPKIFIDLEKICWVLNNLLSNSIKYAKTNGTIQILAHKCDNNIEISVKDNGIGISSENISKIFNKFFRANNEEEGTGLGLALSKQIVELHNGQIYCESEYGIGSTFTVLLPIDRGDKFEKGIGC